MSNNQIDDNVPSQSAITNESCASICEINVARSECNKDGEDVTMDNTNNLLDVINKAEENGKLDECDDISAKENSVVIELGNDKVECETQETNNYTYCGPSYCFNQFVEIAKSKAFSMKQFLVGCKWSPDGSCLLTNCADFTVRLFDLPQKLYNKTSWNQSEMFPDLQPSLKVKEGGQIYDYEWYPFMSSWSPDTCCFITTSTKAPVHLWDAYTGEIRATYRGYNRVDETDNAYSVKFSLDGEKIYCGYNNEIKIFDVSIPGRDFMNIDTKHTAGQSGMISCIAENPGVRNMFAAGSYKKTIGLYLENGDSICLLNGQRKGVTHLIWSHDGVCLYSGARKDGEILCWDMRNPGNVLFAINRIVNTNQRIYFDITPDGKYLISGNTNGEIIIWDLNERKLPANNPSTFKFQAHIDCANGVSVHKQLPLIATSSGQYHFPDLVSDDEDNIFFDFKKTITKVENSIKLWWVGPVVKSS